MKIAYNPTTAAALTAAPQNNDITFDLKGVAIYAKGVKFKGTDTTYSVFKKHTSDNSGGYNGLVPVPSYNSNSKTRFLREDGTWVIPTNTTYAVVSSTANGLAPKIGTAAAATIATQADEWVLTSTKGGTPTWRKLPTNAFNNTNYYRPIQVNGTAILGNNNTALNLVAGTNISIVAENSSGYTGKVTITNTGVRSVTTGDTNGTIKVNTNGTSTNVAVKGLGSAAYTASTAYAVRQTLTDQDLNNVVTPGFYNAGGGNTVANKPSGVEHFGLQVIHGASGSYYVQILYEESYSNIVWRRHCQNGTWSSWTKDALTDTHYTTHLYVGAKDAASNAATTNGSTYIKVTDNSTIRNQYIIKGSGITAVASDANGNITINTPANHNQPTSDINKLTGYAIATSAAALATTDTLNVALGKLEYKLNIAYDLVTKANDGDGTIENLKEILDVLAGIKDTETIKALVGKYLPLAGGTMNNGATIKFNANGGLIQTTATTSNATALIQWYKGTTKDANYSYAAQIGWHNTGDTDGAIYLVPNPQNSAPWGGSVGLYIGKTSFKWNNKTILHSGNTYISSGTITINGTSITPLTAHQSLANYVTLNTAQTISGVKTFSTQQKFTVAQGTAPFTVTSTTKVTNLNADLLDGYNSSVFVRISKIANSTDLNTLTSNLLYYTDTDGNTATLTNAPYTNSFMMLQLQGYSSGDDIRRYRLAINGYGGAKLFDDRDTANTGGTWVDIFTSKNYTTWINTTNFPGLNKTGTVTSVTVTGANGLSGTGTVTTSGTITLSNAGVRSTTINGNYLRVNTNGTNADLTIPYATTANQLKNTSVSDPNTAASGQNVKWYSQISGSSGYAGTNYGFPISNNANGILWLGTHSGPYGWQMGFSSNGRIYARYISNNTFPTTANGGSWNRIAWTSDIPAVTNYYWANIKVSSSSSTTTTPTFATATATTSVTTPLVTTGGVLTLNGKTGVYLKYNNDGTKSIVLNDVEFKPFDTANGKLDLGASDARWKGLYSGTGNFSGNVVISGGTLTMNKSDYNYIVTPESSSFRICYKSTGVANSIIASNSGGDVFSGLKVGLGNSTYPWKHLYLSGAITSSLTTSTHINGNKGTAIINSTAAAGYTMLAKMNSTNGVFNIGTYNASFNLYYTTKTVIDAGTNSTTYGVILLNESGNSSFPGQVSVNTLKITSTSAVAHIAFSRGNYNYISAPASGSIGFCVNGNAAGTGANCEMVISDGTIFPGTTNVTTLGDASHYWTGVYAHGFYKNGSSDSYVLLGGGGHKAESSLSVSYASGSNASHYLYAHYNGGQQTNPQTYFNNGIGVKVAMTGMSSKGTSYWSDTLWINGYTGGDVPNMCALHFNRDGTPRMFISAQSNQATAYGTFYEVITKYNIASQSVSYATTAGTASAVTVTNSDANSTYRMVWHSGNSLYGTGGIYCNPSSDYLYATSMVASSWFRSTGATGWYSATYGGGIYMEDSTWVRVYNNKKFYVNNSEASAIHSAGGVYVAGAVHSYANYLKSTCNGKTITIGSQNASYCHYSTDAPSHWFNKPVYVQGHVYGGSSYNRRLAYVDELPTNTWRPIYWAVYQIFHGTASNVSFTKKAGNHNFFTSGSTTFYRDTQQTILAVISYPSGWNEDTTMIFGNGSVSNTSDYYKPCILTVQKEVGDGSKVRFIMSDDSTVENRACYAWVYFLCIG